jgi:hypothetical protein
LLWAGGVAVFVALSCGEPLGPLSNSWQKVAIFEEGRGLVVEGVAVADGKVYVAAMRGGPPPELVVFVYGEGNIEVDWVLPDAGYDGCMGGIEAWRDVIWAGGTFTVGDEPLKYVPFLIRNDGSGWNSVELGAYPGFGGVGRIYPISHDVCWLLTNETRPEPLYGSLTLYDRGTLRKFPQFPYVTAAYDAAAGALYVIPARETGPVEVAITVDRGKTWVYEKARLESFPGADPARGLILHTAVYGGELFFVVTWETAWPKGTAIYRRTGAPGAGQYEIVFFSNLGPYFRTLDDLTADGTRLMGVGVDTCLIYDGERWQMERPPYKLVSFNALGAAPVGFYATARNDETNGPLELLFHP